ncbi:hypothetical protein Celaphus_00011171 [Cervus elaphus hippelaphus]|uniref:Ferritin light chain n=1 Tax=Cervus elaphus hippelaphus TaxID=46360 RepID=A0A212CQC1_CEREH|nr:hypothetical protein Celaphus_00011171 [Cervus elaphus hippelaphus]
MRLRASYTYLSLGFYLNHDNMALEGVGHFSCELAKERKGMECVLNMQTQRSGCALFLDMQEPPRDEWGKTQDAMEAALLMEKNPFRSAWPGFSLHRPCICDFLENHS